MSAEERDLAERLVHIAQVLEAGSVHETLQRVVDLAVETVPGCEHAGISLVHGRKIATPAASDSVALRLDAVQTEAGQGPCLDAIATDRTFRTDDLAREDRWPDFAARASKETGVVSMVAIRLFARARILGALNLMSSKPAAFDEDSIAIAALYASVAAVALSSAQAEEGLAVALRSRDVIGQAKGVLMERHRITDHEAFARLSTASQRLNLRLSEVAERVVLTGESPVG